MTWTRPLSQDDACEDFTFYPGAVRLQTPSQPDLAGSSQSRWLTHHLYDGRGCGLIVAELLPNAGYAGTVEIGSIGFLWAKPNGVLAKTPEAKVFL